MIPVAIPHEMTVPVEPPPAKEPPAVVYDAPCDICGQLAEWRTVLRGSHHQDTSCECACDEVAA